MPFWNWVKTNIPPYAEEITLNPEVEQIQDTLSKFKQPRPSNFAELGQPKKHWGSTEGLDKSLCERYTFKYDNKLITLDITQELNEKLELNPEENFWIDKKVLSRSPEEGGITIKKEEEIFLERPFTTKNLDKGINRLLKRVEGLEKEKQEKNELITEINRLQKVISDWQEQSAAEKNRLERELDQKNEKIEELKAEKEEKERELEKERGWWDKWIEDDRDFRFNQYEKKCYYQELKEYLKLDGFKNKIFNIRITEGGVTFGRREGSEPLSIQFLIHNERLLDYGQAKQDLKETKQEVKNFFLNNYRDK